MKGGNTWDAVDDYNRVHKTMLILHEVHHTGSSRWAAIFMTFGEIGDVCKMSWLRWIWPGLYQPLPTMIEGDKLGKKRRAQDRPQAKSDLGVHALFGALSEHTVIRRSLHRKPGRFCMDAMLHHKQCCPFLCSCAHKGNSTTTAQQKHGTQQGGSRQYAGTPCSQQAITPPSSAPPAIHKLG